MVHNNLLLYSLSRIGIDAYYLADEVLELSEVCTFPDQIKMLAAATTKEKLDLLIQWLCGLTRTAKPIDPLVREVLHQLYNAPEKLNLSHLYNDLNVTSRHVERRFKNIVGIAPRHLSKALRFQKAVKILRQQQFKSLTEVAYELDYYDQAHFNRHIKELSGFSPSQLAPLLDLEVVNLMA